MVECGVMRRKTKHFYKDGVARLYNRNSLAMYGLTCIM
jgi:hypothetical protein